MAKLSCLSVSDRIFMSPLSYPKIFNKSSFFVIYVPKSSLVFCSDFDFMSQKNPILSDKLYPSKANESCYKRKNGKDVFSMGLLLWAFIILVLIVLDRLCVSGQNHNRRDYMRRKRVSQNGQIFTIIQL